MRILKINISLNKKLLFFLYKFEKSKSIGRIFPHARFRFDLIDADDDDADADYTLIDVVAVAVVDTVIDNYCLEIVLVMA